MKILLLTAGLAPKLILVVVLFGVLSFPILANEILFADNFENGYTGNWNPRHGRWIGIINGGIYRQAIGAKYRLGQSFIKDLVVDDCSVSLKLRFLGGESKKGFGGGLRLRTSFDKSGKELSTYLISLGTGNIGGLSIRKREIVNKKSSKVVLFDSKKPFVKFNQWYEIKVQMKKSKISVWVDGELIAEIKDKKNPILSGMVGAISYGAAIEIDNVIIKGN